MKMISGAARIILAACLAPVVPAAFAVILGLAANEQLAWWTFGLFLVPGYIAMLFVGVPIFLLIRRKGWPLNTWRCVAAGAFSGVVSVSPILAIDLIFGANPLSAKLGWLFFFAAAAVLAGALAGLAFRVIAGPSMSVIRNDSMAGLGQ